MRIVNKIESTGSLIDSLSPGDPLDVHGFKHVVRVVSTDGPAGYRVKVETDEYHELYVADSDVLHVIDPDKMDLQYGMLYVVDPSASTVSNIDVDPESAGVYVWTGSVAVRVARIDDDDRLRSWAKRGYILDKTTFMRLDPTPVDTLRVRAGRPGSGWHDYDWKLLK